MTLTEAQKRKIEQEEKYRTEVKSELKNQKKGIGCFGVMGIIIGFIFLMGVLGSIFTAGKTKTQPVEPDKTEREDLVGNVNFDGTQFHITNQDKKDWKVCYFILNDKYFYPTKTSDWLPGKTLEIIKIGDVFSIGSANFTLTDGTRFNPFSAKPQAFTISCENGFGSWSW